MGLEFKNTFDPEDGPDTAESPLLRAFLLGLCYSTQTMELQPNPGIYYVISSSANLAPRGPQLPYWDITIAPVTEAAEKPNLEDEAVRSQILTGQILFKSVAGGPLPGGYLIFRISQEGERLSTWSVNSPRAIKEYFSDEAIAERIARSRQSQKPLA